MGDRGISDHGHVSNFFACVPSHGKQCPGRGSDAHYKNLAINPEGEQPYRSSQSKCTK